MRDEPLQAKALRSGLVWVNCWLLRDLRTAFGGWSACMWQRRVTPYALVVISCRREAKRSWAGRRSIQPGVLYRGVTCLSA